MMSNEIQWEKRGEKHIDGDGNRYSLDGVVNIIAAKPRLIERLDLTEWYTTRMRNDFGYMGSVLLSPDGTIHEFVPSNVASARRFPVIVCRRGFRTIIVNGIHRLVKALRYQQTGYPCVFVTYRELQTCIINEEASCMTT